MGFADPVSVCIETVPVPSWNPASIENEVSVGVSFFYYGVIFGVTIASVSMACKAETMPFGNDSWAFVPPLFLIAFAIAVSVESSIDMS